MDQEIQTPAPEVPSLALSDLILLFNVVKAAADRGAVKPEEMTAVGTVYEKLGRFLQASGAFTPPAQAEPTDQ